MTTKKIVWVQNASLEQRDRICSRFEFCRDRCIPICWEKRNEKSEGMFAPRHNYDTLRVTDINGKKMSIVFENPKKNHRDNCISLFEENNTGKRTSLGEIKQDRNAFEEAFLVVHHKTIGICQAKSLDLAAPLSRLEALDLRIQALENCIGDAEENDVVETETTSKKRKTTD